MPSDTSRHRIYSGTRCAKVKTVAVYNHRHTHFLHARHGRVTGVCVDKRGTCRARSRVQTLNEWQSHLEHVMIKLLTVRPLIMASPKLSILSFLYKGANMKIANRGDRSETDFQNQQVAWSALFWMCSMLLHCQQFFSVFNATSLTALFWT